VARIASGVANLTRGERQVADSQPTSATRQRNERARCGARPRTPRRLNR
jgi:hypothetical protein